MSSITGKLLGTFNFTFVLRSHGNKYLPAQGCLQNTPDVKNGYCQIPRQYHTSTFCKQRIEESEGGQSTVLDQSANFLFSDRKTSGRKIRPWSFGFMFDVDGVLVRGRRAIPSAAVTIKKVLQLKIPTIFLTNGGCETEEHKARVLSTQLRQKVIMQTISNFRKLLKALHRANREWGGWHSLVTNSINSFIVKFKL